MTLTQSLLTFTLAAALLAATPGVDTALVLRALVASGARRALQAAVGIAAGCLVWGAVVALGLGALLTASPLAFNVLKVVGAAYLLWQGLWLLLRRRRGVQGAQGEAAVPASGAAFWTGFLTNVLNPKVGVFYVTLLPQFVVPGVPAGPYIFALAGIHVGLSLLWFVLLIAAARPLQRWLVQPRVQTTLDRITGGVFVLFGLRLVMAHPQIVRCYSTTGQADYVLTILTTDIEQYEQLLIGQLFKLPGVSHVRSSIVLREIKGDGRVPV